MLQFLTSMSLAELLTTLAAWGGLVLGITNYWQQHSVKLSVTPILSIALPEGGRALCELAAIPLLPNELIAPARQLSSRLAIRITNMRQFPVFIEKYGFCQDKCNKLESIGVKNGTYVAKSFVDTQPQYVTSPFELKPLESVTIEVQDFLPSQKNIQGLITQQCFYVFAQATTGYVKTTNDRKFLDSVLRILSTLPQP